jgi:hypothetical protein
MIAKIYSNPFSTQCISIIDEILEFTFDQNLNNGGRGKIICPLQDITGEVDNLWRDNTNWTDSEIWREKTPYNI